MLTTGGFAFVPQRRLSGRPWGVEPAMGGEPTSRVPLMRDGGLGPQLDHKIICPTQSASSGLFATVERTGDRLVLRKGPQHQRPANGIGAISG